MEYIEMLDNPKIGDSQLRAMWDRDPEFRRLYYERRETYLEEVSEFDFDSACDRAKSVINEIFGGEE